MNDEQAKYSTEALQKVFEVLDRGGRIDVSLPPHKEESLSEYRKACDVAANERTDKLARRSMAATILSALIIRGAPLEADDLAETAVALADALVSELSR